MLFEARCDIKWQDFRTAYGSAEKVPDYLQAITSGSAPQRDEAWSSLYSHIFHQGIIYDAALPVIPYLVEMLRSPSTFERNLVAELLAWLATGITYVSRDAPALEALAGQAWHGFDEKAKMNYLGNLIHEAINPHIPLLSHYLKYREEGTHEIIVRALVRFPAHAETSITALDLAISVEPDPDVRLLMNAAVLFLRGENIVREFQEKLFLI